MVFSIFLIVGGTFKLNRIWASFFYCLFIHLVSVMPLESQLLKREGLKSAGSTPPNCYGCPKPWPSFPSICQWYGIFLFTMIWGERWLLVLSIFMELLVISVLTLLQNCTMFKSGIPVSCKENLILERKNMDANEHDYPNLHSDTKSKLWLALFLMLFISQ